MDIQQVQIVNATLITIGFGMGLGLAPRDFRNILTAPKGVLLGMVGQLVLLPIVAVTLASFAGSPIVAVGLILIGVCPGGSSSNYFAYLAKGDVALSVSLTAVSGVLSVMFVPFVFNFASGLIFDAKMQVSLDIVKTMTRIIFFLILPVIVGMTCRKLFFDVADRIKGWVAAAAFIVLVALTPDLIIKHLDISAGGIAQIFVLVALLLAITMGLGFSLGKLFGLDIPQTRSITVEVGVQNVALSISLALSVLGDSSYALVPAVYLLLMYVFVPGFVFYCRSRKEPQTA